MNAPHDKAIITHPAFIYTVVKKLRSMGAEVFAGDSPAVENQEQAAKKSGMAEAVESAGGRWIYFREQKEINFPEGKLIKKFLLAKELEKIDLIVSLPKLKTHAQMYYTGAMKNLFGLVPGLHKAKWHFRFQERSDFARMIVDLNLLLKPYLSLMDAVICHEGEGPSGGSPRRAGLILGSYNVCALDCIAAGLIGYEPLKIPVLQHAVSSGFWINALPEIKIAGIPAEEAIIKNFKLIKIPENIGFMSHLLPPVLYRLIADFIVPKPVFNPGPCIMCRKCIDICPAGALSEQQKNLKKCIKINNDACIKCYCCHEVCPVKAIDIKKRIFKK